MRVALGIEYDGAQFFGWQRQQQVTTVQAELESALAKIANEPVDVLCAGRTDAGVHATGQVVHFETEQVRPEKAWTMGTNTHLPDAIAVKWCHFPKGDFHARYSATARRYRYVIYNDRLRPGILRMGLTHEHRPLDAPRMHEAAQSLVGENDFSAFRAAHCQSNTPFRNVTSVTVERMGRFVVVDIQANAFVHHMVRNIVGSLLEVGCNEQSVEWIAELLAGRDRTQAAATAKPHGLYLVDVTYPDSFGLPRQPIGPLFLTD